MAHVRDALFDDQAASLERVPSVALEMRELLRVQRRVESEVIGLRLENKTTQTTLLEVLGTLRGAREQNPTGLNNGASEPLATAEWFDEAPEKEAEESISEHTSSLDGSDFLETLTALSTPREQTEAEQSWPAALVRRQFCEKTKRVRSSVDVGLEQEMARQMQTAQLSCNLSISGLGVERRQAYILHPNSNLRTMFDFLSLCALTYDLITTPMTLAWEVDTRGSLLYLSFVTASWWVIDICLSFRTGFFADGVLEMNPNIVARRYLRWFPVDAVVTLGDWLGLAITLAIESESSGFTSLVTTIPRIVKSTKLLRLLNLVRVARFLEPLERVGDQFVSKALQHVVTMCVVLILLMLVNHLLACAWFAISTSARADTGYDWTDMNLLHDIPYRHTNPTFQYLTAFHWALTQMTPGSMPVQPMNSSERLFNIVCLFLGLLFFSSVISSMTSAFTQLKLLALERERTITELETFLRQRAISREMSVAVKKQVMQRMSQKKPLEMEDVQALTMLSLTLREDLKFELFKRHMRSHHLFRLVEQTDSTVFKRICNTGVLFKALLPQDVLFVPDTPCDSAYLVTIGMIEYKERHSTVLTKNLSRRDTEDEQVAQGSWLCWAALWSHWTHVGKAEAGPVSEVLMLGSEALVESISRCTELRELFEEYSCTFHKRLVSASPFSATTWPDDVQVPLANYGEIVLGMQQVEQHFVGLKVLEKLEAQYSLPWQGMSEKRMAELEREVALGRCVLIENREGLAERVVSFTGLRIRHPCGKILVVLAKKRIDSDGELEPEGQLPGVKQELGELPAQALRRLMRDQLRPFAKDLRVHSLRREDRHEHSARYNIKTNYIRVIYSAELSSDFSPLNSTSLTLSKQDAPQSLKQRSAMPEPEACHILKDHVYIHICAFMEPEALEFYRKASGRKHLGSWVSTLTLHT